MIISVYFVLDMCDFKVFCLCVLLSTGGICDGRCSEPICVPLARHLSDINGSAGYSAHAIRMLVGLCQREQGPHRLSVPPQLVCTDCKGKTSTECHMHCWWKTLWYVVANLSVYNSHFSVFHYNISF